MLQKAGETYEYAREFADTKIDLVKLNTAEMMSLGIGKLIMILCLGTLGLIAFIFFMIAGALALSEVLNSQVLGFVITGAFILLLSILIYLFRKILLFNPIVDTIIEMFFQNEDSK